MISPEPFMDNAESLFESLPQLPTESYEHLLVENQLGDRAIQKAKIKTDLQRQLLRLALRMATTKVGGRRYRNGSLFRILRPAFERSVFEDFNVQVVETKFKLTLGKNPSNRVFVFTKGKQSALTKIPGKSLLDDMLGIRRNTSLDAEIEEDPTASKAREQQMLAALTDRYPLMAQREKRRLLKADRRSRQTKFILPDEPHIGRIVLWRETDGELFVPCGRTMIPFKLDDLSVRSIGGRLGRVISRAYSEGLSEVEVREGGSLHIKHSPPVRALRDKALAHADWEEVDEVGGTMSESSRHQRANTSRLPFAAISFKTKIAASLPHALLSNAIPAGLTNAELAARLSEVSKTMISWSLLHQAASKARYEHQKHSAALKKLMQDREPLNKSLTLEEAGMIVRWHARIGTHDEAASVALNRLNEYQPAADNARLLLSVQFQEAQDLVAQAKASRKAISLKFDKTLTYLTQRMKGIEQSHKHADEKRAARALAWHAATTEAVQTSPSVASKPRKQTKAASRRVRPTRGVLNVAACDTTDLLREAPLVPRTLANRNHMRAIRLWRLHLHARLI
jgi:hypothetical protein